ncbi:hypothetical protein SD37_13920 [Amycolatopsis orientalis]|uniref:Uncharacterized protein n=1 Tax=Amycolatopsis orientalis TaxID=31958 RepID=A0A193BWV6_AMYOR|nr:hypothetical protein [Amycolatopsis orientalis]ANN16649.1 hypothetical protein SD37_13920 [Amycolatopsis orientalis]
MSGPRRLPGGEHLVAVARAELPQRDGLAGPFTALAALRAAGFDVAGQDEVAALAGTTMEGLARAIGTLSGGQLAAVPATGDWTPRTLFMLLTALWRLPRVAVIAEVDPAEFGAHDTPERALLDYLDTGVPPLWSSRWRPAAAHFVLVTGLRIGTEGTLLSIMDGYPSLGDNGSHDQPVEWVAAALSRMLIVVDGGDAGAVAAAITSAGLWS